MLKMTQNEKTSDVELAQMSAQVAFLQCFDYRNGRDVAVQATAKAVSGFPQEMRAKMPPTFMADLASVVAADKEGTYGSPAFIAATRPEGPKATHNAPTLDV